MNHLAMTSAQASQKYAAVLASSSLEPNKAYRSKTCCYRQIVSHHAKPPKNLYTRVSTIGGAMAWFLHWDHRVSCLWSLRAAGGVGFGPKTGLDI
jgi:hypothetical protein